MNGSGAEGAIPVIPVRIGPGTAKAARVGTIVRAAGASAASPGSAKQIDSVRGPRVLR